MATKTAILTAIQMLQSLGIQNAPRPEQIPGLVAVWLEDFADLSDEDLALALREFRRDPKVCQFWPQPGTILASHPSRKLAAIDDSGEAWGRVLRLAEQGRLYRRYGGAIAELTPAEQAGVDACGGRDALATSGYDAHGWMQAAFRRAYQAASQAGAVLEAYPQLTDAEAGRFLRLVDGGGR
jgi:hypothetical protein